MDTEKHVYDHKRRVTRSSTGRVEINDEMIAEGEQEILDMLLRLEQRIDALEGKAK